MSLDSLSSIEWRFATSSGLVANNLVSHNLRARTTGTMEAVGNIEGATSSDFIDAASSDLHLSPSSAAVNAGDDLAASSPGDDIDGEARGGTDPDVGADEI